MAKQDRDNKLKMHSQNVVDENIAIISGLFPGCVTEARDANGNLRYAVDFDQLRKELSDHIVEGPQERYRLDWPGKREALLAANAPIAKTLRPCPDESVDFDTTESLFIEGDNLDALKLVQETYLGRVKLTPLIIPAATLSTTMIFQKVMRIFWSLQISAISMGSALSQIRKRMVASTLTGFR